MIQGGIKGKRRGVQTQPKKGNPGSEGKGFSFAGHNHRKPHFPSRETFPLPQKIAPQGV